MTARCEPPPELRDREGWHWLEFFAPSDPPKLIQELFLWSIETRPGCWIGLANHARTSDEMAQVGWRYVAPVTPAAEVAALRERVVNLEAALSKIALARHHDGGLAHQVIVDHETLLELRAALTAAREPAKEGT